MDKISNWGHYPQTLARVHACHNQEEARQVVRTEEVLIARGNGRCYGDSSLQRNILSTLPLNRILAFDPEKGLLTGEAGVLLSEVLAHIVPQGFLLPVLPGTKHISLGGAVAANVHGKNHPQTGAISRWIRSLKLLTEEGQILHCSPEEHRELFAQTIGGLGLTGIILEVTLQLHRIETTYLRQETIRSTNLNDTLALLKDTPEESYTVAWLDGSQKGQRLGRGLVSQGQHLSLDQLPQSLQQKPLKVHRPSRFNIPVHLPGWVLNPFSIRSFNAIYYHWQSFRRRPGIVHYDPFFFPLDAIGNWNRLYGKSGFVQYQFVLPFENAEAGIRHLLSEVTRSACVPFLSVLKKLGTADPLAAPISFPMPGFTLALDFKRTDRILPLLDKLDHILLDYGGRIYLAKDARLSRACFEKMYPGGFPHPSRFHSLQSERLAIS